MAIVPFVVPSSLRGYLREPAVPDPPPVAWRDWALAGIASLAAVLEAALRADDSWTALPLGWRVASVVVFLVAVPPALLVRRQQPLFATVYSFACSIVFGFAMSLAEGSADGGLVSFAILLLVPYALYRWGSGRDGLIGGIFLVAAGVVANLTAENPSVGDWIGGFLVLGVPVEVGLVVRYRRSARERAVREAQSRAREDIARELHDTVAHHVSAIAVQAQAGRAVAASDPARAVSVLGVIEEQASRTLAEMRAMVVALRDDSGAELAPQRGVADLESLAAIAPGSLTVGVEVAETVDGLGPAIDAAIYRIAQESVTNAARHARHATRVDVCVTSEGGLVRLTVVDDGQPIDGPRPPGYGLIGMTERATLLGGSLSAGRADGRGWQVTAELPKSEVAT